MTEENILIGGEKGKQWQSPNEVEMGKEYERVKEEVIEVFKQSRTGVKITSNGTVNFIEYPVSVEELTKNILAIDGILIKSDDQSLPNYKPPVDPVGGYGYPASVWKRSQRGMLKAGFVKVIPKKECRRLRT